jgi:hypothetical protein
MYPIRTYSYGKMGQTYHFILITHYSKSGLIQVIRPFFIKSKYLKLTSLVKVLTNKVNCITIIVQIYKKG